MQSKKTPKPNPNPTPVTRPLSKEDRIKQMISKKPEKAAELLREFLKGR